MVIDKHFFSVTLMGEHQSMLEGSLNTLGLISGTVAACTDRNVPWSGHWVAHTTGYSSTTAIAARSLNCSELQPHWSLTSCDSVPGAEPHSCCHQPLHGDSDRIYLATNFCKHLSSLHFPDSAETGQHVQRLHDKNSPKRQSMIT